MKHKAEPVWAVKLCVRCQQRFQTVIGRVVTDVCIECYQCCTPVECHQCGRTFGAVDARKHRHVNTANLVCTDCVYKRNIAALS